ncbi:MAG TPA: hypothetical protein VHB77_03005 [Planctomycetaceae bacterium]|nr:hypothetical protein [Planctomycetaceae bacterium]
MSFQWFRWRYVCIAVLLVSQWGCGSGQVAVYPVSGQVTFKGSPMVGGGTISFVPIDADSGKGAGGKIDADGNYVMTTHRSGDGAPAGKYRVLIRQFVVVEPENVPDGQAPKGESAITQVAESQRIPEAYANPQQSDLTVEVESSQNEFDFDLKELEIARPVQVGA